MSSTPFHDFLFCHFAGLMLLWQLVDLDCGGVMLTGLRRCSARLIWWDVFQCGVLHNDALSSSRLSWFCLGPNRNEIVVELHGSVTSKISYPLLLFVEAVCCCWQPCMLCCCLFEWECAVVCGPFLWRVGALVLPRVHWCTVRLVQLLLPKTLLLWWAGQCWGQRHCCVGLWHRMTQKNGLRLDFGLLVCWGKMRRYGRRGPCRLLDR